MPSKTTDTVFFFGKQRKLNADYEFKVGRFTVAVVPEMIGETSGKWYATLSGFDGDIEVCGDLARSKASATKKLERRVDSLYRTVKKLHDGYGNG